MFSRYDAMSESKVLDTDDQLNYPDPLNTNFNNVQITEIPKLRTISKVDLDGFWVYMLKHYNGSMLEGDDIVLILNNIPYLGMLEPGDDIYFPVAADIYSVRKLPGLP